jgi:hypothetical protein
MRHDLGERVWSQRIKQLLRLSPIPDESCSFYQRTKENDMFITNDTSEINSYWYLIGKCCPSYEGVSITVTKDRDYCSRSGYQVRVWRGEHGTTQSGHVDSGSAKGACLIKYTKLEDRLMADCNCCWRNQIYQLGILLDDGWVLKEYEHHYHIIRK